MSAGIKQRMARILHRRYRELNPTWGGEDAWDQEPQHRRDDFLEMAGAVVESLALNRETDGESWRWSTDWEA